MPPASPAATFRAVRKRIIRPKTDLPESTRIEGARLLQLCGGIPRVPSATRTVPLKRGSKVLRYESLSPS